MIDIDKQLTGDDGFTMTDNSALRLYPLLEDCSVETIGFYTYLKSWKNTNPDNGKPYESCWLSREEIYILCGIGRRIVDRHFKALVKYGLIEISKSSKIRANKQIFKINDPLTEAEFRAHYPDVIERVRQELAESYKRNAEDAEQFEPKRTDWKAEHVALAQPEPGELWKRAMAARKSATLEPPEDPEPVEVVAPAPEPPKLAYSIELPKATGVVETKIVTGPIAVCQLNAKASEPPQIKPDDDGVVPIVDDGKDPIDEVFSWL